MVMFGTGKHLVVRLKHADRLFFAGERRKTFEEMMDFTSLVAVFFITFLKAISKDL